MAGLIKPLRRDAIGLCDAKNRDQRQRCRGYRDIVRAIQKTPLPALVTLVLDASTRRGFHPGTPE